MGQGDLGAPANTSGTTVAVIESDTSRNEEVRGRL